jgi:hypothetical protein
MVGDVERRRGRESDDRQVGSWRIVLSAWALVLLLMFLLAGTEAMASRHGGSHARAHLAGAVIPRHDTACGGPGIPSAPGPDGCENLPAFEDRSAYW